MFFLRTVLMICLIGLSGPAFAGMRLVMVEEAGCTWCARWNREISPIYPKTEEGKLAPLQRIDIKQPLTDELSFKRRLVYTPTFVLIVDGKEVNRIEGYPGEDFFWGLLGKMIAAAPKSGVSDQVEQITKVTTKSLEVLVNNPDETQ